MKISNIIEFIKELPSYIKFKFEAKLSGNFIIIFRETTRDKMSLWEYFK